MQKAAASLCQWKADMVRGKAAILLREEVENG